MSATDPEVVVSFAPQRLAAAEGARRSEEANETTSRPVAGILLAAGMSARMGMNKMLLEIEGESLLHRAARRAREAGLDPLFVVLGHEAERARREIADLPCQVVINERYELGIASSLRAGFAALPPACGAAIVLLADMPRVTPEMLTALVEHYARTGARLVASQYGEVKAPPTLYDASLFEELRAASDTRCAQQIVRRHLDEAVVLSWPVERLEDLDRPEEWAQFSASPGYAGLRPAIAGETPTHPEPEERAD